MAFRKSATMVSSADIEKYVNGKTDQAEFLSKIVNDSRVDDHAVLSVVESVCATLNANLRQEIESNSNRLVEQASSIDVLDEMATTMQAEIGAAERRATAMADKLSEVNAVIQKRVRNITRLTQLNRLLSDAQRISDLLDSWAAADYDQQTTIVVEVRQILKDSPALGKLDWYRQDVQPRWAVIEAKTRANVIDELTRALDEHQRLAVGRAVLNLRIIDPSLAEQEFLKMLNKTVLEIDRILNVVGGVNEEGDVLEHLGKFNLAKKLTLAMERFQMIGNDLPEQLAAKIAQVIGLRLSSCSPATIHVLNVIHTCVNAQPSQVAAPVKSALSSLDKSYVEQRYDVLTGVVDNVFANPKNVFETGLPVLEQLFDEELDRARFDDDFLHHTKQNLANVQRYVCYKITSGLRMTPEVFRYGRRLTAQQEINYDLLNIAYTLSRKYPLDSNVSVYGNVLSDAKTAFLQSINDTVALVLASMHEESMTTALKSSPASMYMKELCGHLTSFALHVNKVMLLGRPVEVVHGFINHVVELFLLHISVIKPLTKNGTGRYAADLRTLLQCFIKGFNCRTSLYLIHRETFISTIEKLPASISQENAQTALKVVPRWFVINSLIVSSDLLSTPHESVNWSIGEYVEWFLASKEDSRVGFYASYLKTIKHHGGKAAAVQTLPLIERLVEEWEKESTVQQSAAAVAPV